MALTSAVSNFAQSIYELFASFFGTILHLVELTVSTVWGVFASVLHLFGDFGQGIADIIGGFGRFLLANAALILVGAAAGYGYLVYQQRQGHAVVVQGKKLN
ncbi:hypothetical protein EJ06DRAFT_534359 [Trichodelitschia bisporula]|uniref:Uncharacterized protein n=1 Tax=Trichodelitschia bisporula TaxID=703511 RepID=A0A6G1HJI6_9PEZI|nr:hypothetical protein EJ06DRAFT_534359 [Trichodelitschia bisporula]